MKRNSALGHGGIDCDAHRARNESHWVVVAPDRADVSVRARETDSASVFCACQCVYAAVMEEADGDE